MSRTKKLGPHEHAADRVASAALARGITGLRAAFARYVALYGEEGAFHNNEELKEIIFRPDGRPYHRESYGRIRRAGSREGFWSHRRIPPGMKPNKLAKHRSSHGTALNVLHFGAFLSRMPTLRGSRRRQAHALENRRTFNAPRGKPEQQVRGPAVRSIEETRALARREPGVSMPDDVRAWIEGGMQGPPPHLRGPP